MRAGPMGVHRRCADRQPPLRRAPGAGQRAPGTAGGGTRTAARPVDWLMLDPVPPGADAGGVEDVDHEPDVVAARVVRVVDVDDDVGSGVSS